MYICDKSEKDLSKFQTNQIERYMYNIKVLHY